MIRRKGSREEPKIAIRKDWRTAAAAASIHFLPVSAAVIICGINLHGYYIGGELTGTSGQDDMKLGSLQFAAKLHELTMQASLAAVVFGYVRDQLALGEGIPFGAVFAGLQIKEVSFFWSREFWGAMLSSYPDLRRRLELLFLLVIGTLLGVSVGPSSAIVLKPRMDDWPAGGTRFYLNATSPQLFPPQLNSSHVPSSCVQDEADDSCSYRGWRDIQSKCAEHWTRYGMASKSHPEFISLSSKNAVRELYFTARTGLFGNPFSLATTQHAVLANALVDISRLWAVAAENVGRERFTSRRDVSFTIDGLRAQQPITHVSCAQTQVNYTNSSVPYDFRKIDSLEAYENNRKEFPIARDNLTVLDLNYLETLDEPRLNWTQLPEPIFGGNSIGAIASFPRAGRKPALVYMCTVDARWAPATIKSRRSRLKVVTGEPEGWLTSGVFNPSWPRISISTEWAAGLSPRVDNSSSAFARIATSAGLWKLSRRTLQPKATPAVESLLAVIVTNGLARTYYNTTLLGELKLDPTGKPTCQEWCEQLIPRGLMTVEKFNQRLGQAFRLPATSASSTGSVETWNMQVNIDGYAYSTRGQTMKVAVGILLAYVLVAVAHAAWSLKTGISLGCWDTASEITALAMNSARTDMLRNTCSGIETFEPFKQTVRVVMRRGRHLEMMFGPVARGASGEQAADDDHSGGVCKISENEFYG